MQAIKASDQFDLVENSFLGAGETVNVRAGNVNALDEVPDSSWFTNRLGRRPMTTEEIARGPCLGRPPPRSSRGRSWG